MRSTGRQGVFVGGVGDPVVRDDNSDGAGSDGASQGDQSFGRLADPLGNQCTHQSGQVHSYVGLDLRLPFYLLTS